MRFSVRFSCVRLCAFLPAPEESRDELMGPIILRGSLRPPLSWPFTPPPYNGDEGPALHYSWPRACATVVLFAGVGNLRRRVVSFNGSVFVRGFKLCVRAILTSQRGALATDQAQMSQESPATAPVYRENSECRHHPH